MLNTKGEFIGQLCHIEAAEAGGERFRMEMTNEERRSAANLMLMCYKHHVETNDVELFPVSRMKQMKSDHERRFSHPDRAILSTLKDYTKLEEVTYPQNLKRANHVLQWGHTEEVLRDTVDDLETYLATFVKVPIELRHFIGKVAERTHHMEGLDTVYRSSRYGCPTIRFDDLQGAFQMTEATLINLERQLSSYGLGYMDPIPDEYDNQHEGLKLRATEHDWCLWEDLANFCAIAGESIEVFSVEMDLRGLTMMLPHRDRAHNV